MNDTFRSALVLSVNLNRYAPKVASHIMFPEIWNFGLSNFISGFLLSFNHLYQELFGTENPDFPAGNLNFPDRLLRAQKSVPGTFEPACRKL